MINRQPARTKMTKSGRIMGRPSKTQVDLIVKDPSPKLTRRLVGQAPPRSRLVDGVYIAVFGPPKPIYEYIKKSKGRPVATTSEETLWIIRSIDGENRPGYAEELAVQMQAAKGNHAMKAEGVKRKLTSVRAQTESRKARSLVKISLPRRIADIPE
ncbi:hypothetical protein [Methylobacterium sp. WL116]|uniref:hypothetical protein n=1 Tax=Methylobacterium sp. WL116 TaxID=2603889 RepID=UPI0011C9FA93|nr:hypothetical protein [Methylobacterium sp. WL116]TXM94683.1 hypothetical protein FV223_03815 [Methylobacterium sp. WL116]